MEDITVEGVTGKEAEVAKAVLGVLQKVVNGKLLSYVGTIGCYRVSRLTFLHLIYL